MAAIIGICTATEHRRKGNTKDLNIAFNKLQDIFKCKLYLFVDKTNPLYNVLVELYSKMGFVQIDKRTSFSKFIPKTQKVLEMMKK